MVFDSISSHLTALMRRRGPRWRATPWWPSDSRRSKQEALIRLLAVAHEQRMDPVPLIANLASEHRGNFRRRAYRLSARLRSGTPIVSALEQTPDVLSDQDVLAIRFGTQSGTLRTTYEALLEKPVDTWDRTRARMRELAVYACIMFGVLVLLIVFLFNFIVPTLMSIDDEFGTVDETLERPLALRWLFNAYSNSETLTFLLAVGILVLVATVYGPVRRLLSHSFAARFVSPIAQLRTADLLKMLSIATEAGRPIPASLSTLARYHFDRPIRAKLLFVRNEVEQGAEVWTSLADAKLLSSAEAHALAVSTSNRSRSWAMRRLAQWKRQQVLQYVETVVFIARPLLTLVLAALVLVLCVAAFQFLTRVIFLHD